MNQWTLRIVIGFVVAFVLLSLAPSSPAFLSGASHFVAGAPDLLAAANRALAGIATDDLLLGVAALLAGMLLVRRRQAVPVVRRAAPAAARASSAMARSARPVGSARDPARQDTLAARIRAAARNGERVPALARQHQLSQDAIRVAIGPAASSAGLPGSSFRSRQRLSPGAPAARAAIPRRTSYRAPA
jgi:hypothetical protein